MARFTGSFAITRVCIWSKKYESIDSEQAA
jgi:hypothetical protein